MMPIAETRSFDLGPYTVLQRPRHDNPYWPQYAVFRADRFIGCHFSIPDLGCCQWLEKGSIYAEHSAQPATPRKYQIRRGGRPTNAERARRLSIEALVAEAA